MVIADAVKRRYTVSIPISENIKYDLVVDRGGRPERVQCKTTKSDGEVIKVKCHSTSSWGKKTHSTTRYTEKDIEWIVAYDVTTDRCYYIPASILGPKGRTCIYLRLVPTKSGRKKGVNLASNFTDW